MNVVEAEREVFRCSSSDTGAKLGVWVIAWGAGCLPFPFLAWQYAGMVGAALFVVTALLLMVGMRSTIVVLPKEVVITKSWFRIPYRRYRAAHIDGVWFGGDWGDSEGACGVVIQLGGHEVHCGNRGNMQSLHDALKPHVVS